MTALQLLSPKALPDRGWRFVLRGGIGVEQGTGKIEASGYLFQERRYAFPVLGVPDPRVVVRSRIVALSNDPDPIDPDVLRAARDKQRYLTAQVSRGEGSIQLWRFSPVIDPLGGYGLWVGIVVDLWCAGEIVGYSALTSEVIPLRGTDWDGPKPAL